MIFLTLGLFIFLLGGLLCLIFPNNSLRSLLGIMTNGCGCVLALLGIFPILQGDPPLHATLQWVHPLNEIVFHLDALGAFFLCFSLPITFFATIYARGYIKNEKQRHVGVHYFFLNMTSLSYLVIYTISSPLAFLCGWELAAISAWLLVIWEHHNQNIRFAGFNYLVSTHIGLFFLIAGLTLLPQGIGPLAFTYLLISFGLKSAFFPFHTWLPRAHSAAPAHVSALMSGVIHKAGLYGLLRFTLMMGEIPVWVGYSVMLFSFLSVFFGAMQTVAQRDIKRLLGYSSTENVGIAGIGFGLAYLGITWQQPVLSICGFACGLLHIFNHSLFKCLLFYAAGCIYKKAHTIDIERLGGLAKKMPWTAALYLLGSAAITGLPPLNGFISEFLLYIGLWQSSAVPATMLKALCLASAALLAFVGTVSALSMTRSFGIAFLGTERDAKISSDGEAPWTMLLPMFLHGFAIILLGLFPFLSMHFLKAPLQLLMHGFPPSYLDTQFAHLKPVSYLGLAFYTLVLGFFLFRYMRMRPSFRVGSTWGCGYTLPNSRMQYTGSSYSQPFLYFFKPFFKIKQRLEKPIGLFPTQAYKNTHSVDQVETLMFASLGRGEKGFRTLANWLQEKNPWGFCAIFLFLVLTVLTFWVLHST